MENTILMWTLSFGLFCNASEQPNKPVKSLMDEYHNSFKPQLETQQERRFGRGSSGPSQGQIDVAPNPMKVDQRIADLKLKRSQKLDGISQRARGDMTAHKALYKKAELELNMINKEIEYLEQLNVFFVGFNQLAKL